MQIPPPDSWELPSAMGMGDLWAFERFLANGASESTVAAFLQGMGISAAAKPRLKILD